MDARQRFLPVLLLCAFTLVAGTDPCAASTFHHPWQADSQWQDVCDAESLARLLAGGQMHSEAAGRPACPRALERGHPGRRAAALRAPGERRQRGDRAERAAAAFPGPPDGRRRPLAPAAAPYPEQHLLHASSSAYRGFALAEILLAPLLTDESGARPILRRLVACEIVLETEPDPGFAFPCACGRATRPGAARPWRPGS